MIAAAMAAQPPLRRQLSSWKEIAVHLGVTERTAQKWEHERGLPVHRLPGEKGRVIAWTDELDRWRAAVLDKPSWWVSVSFWRALGATGVLILAAAVITVLVMASLRLSRGPAVQFRLDVRTLIVTDERGREVWRKTFDEPFVEGSTPEVMHAYHRVSFADLDADGRKELLFAYRPQSEDTRGETLYCFSSRGRELWRYQATRTVSTPEETFPPPYLGGWVLPLPAGRDGRRNVLYVAHHLSYFPAPVVLLSPEGRVLGEYWHSGHLMFGEAVQLDGRPAPDILLAGISNSYKTTTLIALDPANMQCASDESENPAYQIDVPGRNCELARILFPRTCISRKFDAYSIPVGLIVHPDRIQVGTTEHYARKGANAVFYLNRQLALQSAEVIDSFLAHHRELEAEGQLDHPFSDAELRALHQVRILRHWKFPASPASSTQAGAGAPPHAARR